MPSVHRAASAGRAGVLVLAAVLATGVFVLGSSPVSSGGESWRQAQSTPEQKQPLSDDAREQILKKTCTECHRQPTPDILPRDIWRETIYRMMFIREKRLPPVRGLANVYRTIALPDDMAEVLKYMEAHAPERLAHPEPWPDPGESPVQFVRSGLSVPEMPNDPAVSNVNILDFDGDGKLDVLATEMRQGMVFWGPLDGSRPLTVIASIPHPDHVTLTDVDGDGVKDLLVADLGQFLPADHHDGAIIWLRGLGNGKFSSFWIDGWPRIADVESADFNGDGKNDLAVAAFGWRTTGNISILENQSEDATKPVFVPHEIDKRPGGIHIIPIDLNRDGKMDFITLLAQQFETVLSYTNTGKGDFSFVQRVIYAAPHPNWGSSGIQAVDLDKDGDVDVLYTHGDSFDDGLVKPYHGIQWLENTGGPFWQDHPLVQMAGVHRALAVDLDGDGDLDIVACGLLAGGSDVDEKTLPALVWLEQTKPGVFARHTIEMGFPRHATLDVADVDGDGDPDIVTGYFSIDKPAPAWIEVWRNQLNRPKGSTGLRP